MGSIKRMAAGLVGLTLQSSPSELREMMSLLPNVKETESKFYPSPKKIKNPKMQLSKALQTVMEADLEEEGWK